jgi:mRNA interferase MazF
VTNRGSIVIVDFPFASGAAAKKRPALVIQNNRDNQRLSNTIVAMITGNTSRAAEATHLLIDPLTKDGIASGLRKPSIVNCTVLYTIEQRDIAAVIGSLSPALMAQVNQCLKAALEIS